jgi:hypothetical protein
MDIQYKDFNGVTELFAGKFERRWAEIVAALAAVRPHLKASDQAGIQGEIIFDPVGTNSSIKDELFGVYGWAANVSMPEKFSFLGKDVDFVKGGVLVEVQFSNYPFLLNNTIRSELLFKSKTSMNGAPIDVLVIISKARMFPSSNSTLYYEQAVSQLTELARNRVFDVPTRLVGLFAARGIVDAVFTDYHAARYSRTVLNRVAGKAEILGGYKASSRNKFKFT